MGHRKSVEFYCDRCNETYQWGFNSVAEGKRLLTETGWTFGRIAICHDCHVEIKEIREMHNA